ncbi:hypothetical protein MHC_06025 [Mycoplasma haemocanis str. Illinois]|uniref:Uncharacterized protein n=1 Tax=Mycoplasma haemocanis (strain Illinois) TaxID=1111676 RepID=I6RHR3_MYCHN|nr:hypothetical protein MHC_06025 [Mycoplasma haemocanis str. Illinois]
MREFFTSETYWYFVLLRNSRPLKINGEKMITESIYDSQLWKKYYEIKDPNVINKYSEEGLKNWCNEQKDKEFSNEGVFEVYPRLDVLSYPISHLRVVI